MINRLKFLPPPRRAKVYSRRPAPFVLSIAICCICITSALADAPANQDASAKAQSLIDKGLTFLKSQQQPDGSWQKGTAPPAITAIVLKAFVSDPSYSTKDPLVAKGFDRLLSNQKDDGGIYKDMLANYNTAIAISALSAAKDPKFQPNLDKAIAFLKRLQWSNSAGDAPERKTVDENDPRFGGWGYGGKQRPDGSNMQLALDALYDSGLKCDDPAFQNAIRFINRLQNFSETNDQAWAGNDGGFVYSPALGGESFAGEYTGPDGKRMLRSYGSMTYAGLKSFIYAGVSKQDARVRAAFDWISKNWTLDENPGMRLNDPATAANGIYYYYHTLARAMNAYDEPVINDAQGRPHDWRVELVHKLTSLQKPDGSWIGEKRWMESDPVLVTAYCVLALQEAKHDLAEHPAK